MASDSINFLSLRQDIAKTRSVSSARLYLATVGRLESYCGCSELPLHSVDSEFISGFGDYMLREGLKPSSIKQMKMVLRALLKPLFGSDRRHEFLEAFSGLDSVAESRTNAPALSDIRRLSVNPLGARRYLMKIRDIFMLSFYEGGLTLDEMKSSIADLRKFGTPQSRHLMHRFEHDFAVTVDDCITSLSADDYARALDAIGSVMTMKCPINPSSSSLAWEETARCLGVEPEVVAAVTGSRSAIARHLKHRHVVGDSEKSQALATVASAVTDINPKWFVMRCLDHTPEHTASAIRSLPLFSDYDFFDTFIVPAQKIKGTRSNEIPLLRSTLFFNCSTDNAAALRRSLGTSVYVYTRPGTSQPAPISSGEMKTFMLLCSVGENVIAHHFPDYGLPPSQDYVGRRARIICGSLEGLECYVVKAADGKYNVTVSIESIGSNLRLTGTVPFDFLKFDDNNALG